MRLDVALCRALAGGVQLARRGHVHVAGWRSGVAASAMSGDLFFKQSRHEKCAGRAVTVRGEMLRLAMLVLRALHRRKASR